MNKSDLYKYLKLKEVSSWADCVGGKGMDLGAGNLRTSPAICSVFTLYS